MQSLLLNSLINDAPDNYYEILTLFKSIDSKETNFKMLTKEEGDKLLEEIFLKVFSTTKEDLNNLQKIQGNAKFYNFVGNYNIEGKIEDLDSFLGPILNTQSINKRMYEYAHIKMFLRNLHNPVDDQYLEFIPTAVENLSAYYLSTKCGKEELESYKKGKINEMKEISNALITYTYLFKDSKIEELPKEIQTIIRKFNDKFLSYIFSNRIFELFKEDKGILTDIKEILEKRGYIEDLIDEYDLSTNNFWTMNATYKLLGINK